ncbi:MAG: hypothetical protein Q8O04_02555 [Deltaproteobacteria bacterium]|nr:hypothetical protein [Deltaproteobacteria bacterium]
MNLRFLLPTFFFVASVRWTSFQRLPTKSLPPVGSVHGSSSHQNQG